MRYMRFLTLFVMAFTTGLGGVEAATFGPPPSATEADLPPSQELAAPAALGAPCSGTMTRADRQEMAFTVDFFGMGPTGYAPMGPPGNDGGVLALICRMATFPIARN